MLLLLCPPRQIIRADKAKDDIMALRLTQAVAGKIKVTFLYLCVYFSATAETGTIIPGTWYRLCIFVCDGVLFP